MNTILLWRAVIQATRVRVAVYYNKEILEQMKHCL